jgi:hypothetical protein
MTSLFIPAFPFCSNAANADMPNAFAGIYSDFRSYSENVRLSVT